MIDKLIVLGGAGDLTMRYLLPALAELDAAGRLDPALRVVSVVRNEESAREYGGRVRDALDEACADAGVARRVSALHGDATDAGALRQAAAGARGVAAYLALPPSAVPGAVEALAEAGLPPGSRVVLEKPFGDDVASARALNALLARRFERESVLRVDHFLGLRAVRNLAAFRAANRAIDAALSAEHVERVEVTWDETLRLEGRAGYYDGTGALRDMVQSHLLQVLAMFAMDAPASYDPADIALARLDVLRRTRLRGDGADGAVLRARYGKAEDGDSVAYVDEEGVDPSKGTETFVRVELEVQGPRWEGVTFALRTGKALARDRAEVTVVFRPGATPGAPANRLVFDLLDGAIALDASAADGDDALRPVRLEGRPGGRALSAYARVLDAALRGDGSVSVGPAEPEESWRIVAPALAAFRDGRAPLETYPAGSDGPEPGGGRRG
ncbi:MAG: glucose-6-phosphate dehydrogenase [Deltaproteobacteria bacterium]|nr:hypothetical protein [Myxococcales bacterium]MDP3217447.1 glucose-6-phosphate dehydrogenase [Deltaproteobacteria bacterium]